MDDAKTAGIVAGLIVIAVGGYLVYRWWKEREEEPPPPPPGPGEFSLVDVQLFVE